VFLQDSPSVTEVLQQVFVILLSLHPFQPYGHLFQPCGHSVHPDDPVDV